MLTLLKNWEGPLTINDTSYDSVADAPTALNGQVRILLHPKTQTRQGERSGESKQAIVTSDDVQQYRITVKAYMTKPATPEFDFMLKWNNDVPMPLRTMTGTIEKETRGMVYMNLHGQGEKTCNCMRCGRELTNAVSKLYGIGPECMSKLGLVRDITEVDDIKKDLVNVEWSGWIIKSAIISEEEV